LAALFALLVAGVSLLARLIRLGWIADYFSRAVLIGYIHGVAAVLIVGQHGNLFGLDVDARDPLAQLAELAREIRASSGATIAVGVACLAALLLLRPLAPRIPGSLLVVAVAIATSAALELEAHGVAVVGAIPSGLPSFAIPAWRLEHAVGLLPAALGIFLVGFADQILTARLFAGRRG
jgi:sulfate permease, SulP family